MSDTFHFVKTEDGSFTAYSGAFAGEKMHHLGGAFSESVYIYGPVVQWAFAREDIARAGFISVGTGLGYNEIITAAMSMLFEKDFRMDSFEKDENLNRSLSAWVLNNEEANAVEKSVYDVTLEMAAKAFEVNAEELKTLLYEKYQDGSWRILGKIPELESFDQKYNGFFYDLFSFKAMEPYWAEEYLTKFLNLHAEPACALATYSCTGNLKRASIANGLQFIKRRGYKWKRHSSFAYRK